MSFLRNKATDKILKFNIFILLLEWGSFYLLYCQTKNKISIIFIYCFGTYDNGFKVRLVYFLPWRMFKQYMSHSCKSVSWTKLRWMKSSVGLYEVFLEYLVVLYSFQKDYSI